MSVHEAGNQIHLLAIKAQCKHQAQDLKPDLHSVLWGNPHASEQRRGSWVAQAGVIPPVKLVELHDTKTEIHHTQVTHIHDESIRFRRARLIVRGHQDGIDRQSVALHQPGCVQQHA